MNYIDKLKKSIEEYKKKGLKELIFYLNKKNHKYNKKHKHTALFYLHRTRRKKKRLKQQELFKLNFSKLHHRGEYKLNNIMGGGIGFKKTPI